MLLGRRRGSRRRRLLWTEAPHGSGRAGSTKGRLLVVLVKGATSPFAFAFALAFPRARLLLPGALGSGHPAAT
eukprot:10293515-Prorocentrum_lima.AAC.1